MGVLIDTSLLIAAERRGVSYDAVPGVGDDEPLLSVITASELLYGVHRAADPTLRARRSARVEPVLARFRTLSLDAGDARVHAALRAELDCA